MELRRSSSRLTRRQKEITGQKLAKSATDIASQLKSAANSSKVNTKTRLIKKPKTTSNIIDESDHFAAPNECEDRNNEEDSKISRNQQTDDSPMEDEKDGLDGIHTRSLVKVPGDLTTLAEHKTLSPLDVELSKSSSASDDDDSQDDVLPDHDSDFEPPDDGQLYCICRKPYAKRFMICCDKCDNWYHGFCVGISRVRGKEMDINNEEYICPVCKDKLGKVPSLSTQGSLSTQSGLSLDQPNVRKTKRDAFATSNFKDMGKQNKLPRYHSKRGIKPDSSHQSQTVYSPGVSDLASNDVTYNEYNATGMTAPLASENSNPLIILEGSAAWESNVADNNWKSETTTLLSFQSERSTTSPFKQNGARTLNLPFKSQQNIRRRASSYFRSPRIPNHRPQPRLYSPNRQHTVLSYNSPTCFSSPCQPQHRKKVPSRGHQCQETTPPKYSPNHFQSVSELSPPITSGHTMMGNAVSRQYVPPASALCSPSRSSTKPTSTLAHQQNLTHYSALDQVQSTPSPFERSYHTRTCPSPSYQNHHSTSRDSIEGYVSEIENLVFKLKERLIGCKTFAPSTRTCPERVISVSSTDREETFTDLLQKSCDNLVIVINDTPPPSSPVSSAPTSLSQDRTVSPPICPTPFLSSQVAPVRPHELVILDSDEDDECT